MLMAKVLLVSDDSDSVWVWSQLLAQKGMDVTTVDSSEQALDRFAENCICDLVVIDEYTSQLDGIDLVQKLRYESGVPLLLLIPNQDEARGLQAYDADVDECIMKPISPRLFVAKVRAWLRRTAVVPRQMTASFQVGDLQLDPAHGQLVTADGSIIKLTNLEFRLLHVLMSNPGQVLESSTLISRVWGYADEGDTNVLKNVVYRLRRKIETDPAQPQYIHSVVGEGYMFRPQESLHSERSSP